MKPGRTLVLLLVLCITALIVIRQRKDNGAKIPPAPEEVLEKSPSASPAPIATVEADASPSAPADPQAPKSEDGLEKGNHLQVIVQNETGQPLEGVSIRTSFRGELRLPALTNLSRTFTTGSHGLADVLWPTQKIEQLELLVAKDDYSPRKMIWDFQTGDPVPASYTVKLQGSISWGGLVVDPEGNPLAEATVSLSRFWSGGEAVAIKYQGEEVTFPTQKYTTSTDGKWTARNVPPELIEHIAVTGSHSNFIDAGVMLVAGLMPDAREAERELRAGTYKLRLTRGFEVHGRIINEEQKAIAHAQVWAGRKYTRGRKSTETDELGRFTFQNVAAGKVDFSASAEGYAPNYKTQEVGVVTGEVVLQLAKGSIIRGVVQDESSQPVAGVRVVLEGSPSEPAYNRFEFSTTTDSAGQFEWRSAPNGPAPFYFGKSGYQQRRGVRLKPGEDNVVTLRLNPKVQGQVLDAATEQPVTRFTAFSGRSPGGNQFFPDSHTVKEFKSEQGLFSLELDDEYENAVQIVATNYAAQTELLPVAENGEVKVVFKLKASEKLVGMVVTPAGQPVAGAKVAVVDDDDDLDGRSVQLAKGKLRSRGSRAQLITTDAAGHFEIPSPPEDGTVVAANGAGYGAVPVAEVKATGLLILQPFGRIEGVLLQGTAPGAAQEVMLTAPDSGIFFDLDSTKQTTDAQGNFAFEKVPAGTLSIVRMIKASSRSSISSHNTSVVVTAGQTTQIVLGGTDATLQGQARFETAPPDGDYRLSAELNSAPPRAPDGLTPEERKAYYGSAEWKEQITNLKNYAAIVNPDGTVLIDGIAPGQYTLKISAHKPDADDFRAQPIATGEITVSVPAGASPNIPIQIGEVLLRATKK